MAIKPKLGQFDLTMIVVSLVIGMGIFRTPVEVAQKSLTASIFFAAWVTGAVASLFGALTFAEIGSRYPVAGGFYRIFSFCYNPIFAFMVNWMTIISNAASTAIVAIIGAEYINPILFPTLEHDFAVRITTVTSVVLLYLVNMLGIKMSARVLNVLMIIKIGLLVLLVTAAFMVPPATTSATPTTLPVSNWLSSFWLCFVPVFFTYGGYQQTINFGSDIPNASRTLPRAIFFGIAIILILYLLVNFSYVHVLGFDGLRNSTALAADTAGSLFGPSASRITAVLMFLSVMAYVNASILSNPRIYYAMAEDQVLPAVFKRLNDRTQVQEFAVTVFVVFMIITLFLTSSFSKVLNYVMFFDSISLACSAAALFILRHRAKKNGEPKGIYKMKGYPWMPALFIIIYLLVNVSVMVSNPKASAIGFLLFLSGWPLYLILKKLITGNSLTGAAHEK